MAAAGGDNSIEMKCRLTRFGLLEPEIFNRVSCTNCYKLLEFVFSGYEFPLSTDNDGYLLKDGNQDRIDPNLPEGMKYIEKMLQPIEFEKWRSCCDEAAKCCSNMLEKKPNLFEIAGNAVSSSSTLINKALSLSPSSSSSSTTTTNSNNNNKSFTATCPPIWDGWSCHAATPAGKTSVIKCPEHFIADTCNSILGHASFDCDSNGNWFKNELGEWADYSNCLQSILPIKQQLITVNIVCHSISLALLIIGLIIFFSYRKLRVNRITLHKNFFLSLILHSLLQIIWESVIMRENLTNSSLYIDSNHPGCILTNVFLQYTRSTNYFWMFSESFYLHRLLLTVFKEQSNLFIFYFFGWGVPFLLCIIYAILTLWLNNNSCWTKNIYLIYIMNAPNILTIILNFVFLINIIRVLYKKLTASNTNEPHQYRRAVRATLILVPLFGLHLILSPYVMCESAPGSQVHNLINRLVESLQGSMVALIYCFCNSEVTFLLKNSLLKLNIFKFLKAKGGGESYEKTYVTSADYDTTINGNGSIAMLKRLSLVNNDTLNEKNNCSSNNNNKANAIRLNNNNNNRNSLHSHEINRNGSCLLENSQTTNL